MEPSPPSRRRSSESPEVLFPMRALPICILRGWFFCSWVYEALLGCIEYVRETESFAPLTVFCISSPWVS